MQLTVGEILKNKAVVSSSMTNLVIRPSKEEVNAMGKYLSEVYKSPDFEHWYCQVVYELGTEKVLELMKRAEKAIHPGRYFSSAAKSHMRTGKK